LREDTPGKGPFRRKLLRKERRLRKEKGRVKRRGFSLFSKGVFGGEDTWLLLHPKNDNGRKREEVDKKKGGGSCSTGNARLMCPGRRKKNDRGQKKRRPKPRFKFRKKERSSDG